MILQIKDFQFSVNMSYETLQRAMGWRWEEVKIVGTTPKLQFAGKDSPAMTFEGTWWNYSATGDNVASIESLADAGEPLSVTGDNGFYYGKWVITRITRAEEFFRPGQHSSIKTVFTISMKFHSDSPDPVGEAPSSPARIAVSAVTAKQSISSMLNSTQTALETIGESADDSALDDLMNVEGFSGLANESKRNARTLKIPAVPESDNLHDLPGDSGFFDNIEDVDDILSKRRDTQNKIGRVSIGIRKLPGYNTLRNTTGLGSVQSALLSAHRSLDSVESVQKEVNRVLHVKGAITRVALGR